MKRLDVLIIDDHLLVAKAWQLFLQSQDEFESVHYCRSAEEGISFLEGFKPDIILLDVSLPRINGIEAIPAILNASPSSRIIGLSIHALPAYVKQMMANGAYGYLTKGSTTEEVQEAIKQVMAGKKYICNEIRDALAATVIQSEIYTSDLPKLTKREKEFIGFMKQGLNSDEIAQIMSISIKTTEVYRYSVLKKLKLNNAKAILDFILKNDPLI